MELGATDMIRRDSGCFLRVGLLGCCLWSAAAAWFSAHQLVSVQVELLSYWLVVPTTLISGIKFAAHKRRCIHSRQFLVRCISSSVALLIALGAWYKSNDIFAFWKLRMISATQWPQMISDLQASGKESADRNGRSIDVSAMPKSLRFLGNGTDYVSLKGYWVDRAGYKGLIAYTELGYKVRVWGLFVGPEHFLQEGWPRFKRVRVGNNAFFILGARG
jgi:hypothetical protein